MLSRFNHEGLGHMVQADSYDNLSTSLFSAFLEFRLGVAIYAHGLDSCNEYNRPCVNIFFAAKASIVCL